MAKHPTADCRIAQGQPTGPPGAALTAPIQRISCLRDLGETPDKLHIGYRIRSLQFQPKAFRISHFHRPTT